MRITLEIDEDTLAEVLRLTGESKKSPALAAAIGEYVDMHRRRRLVERALRGETGYSATNEVVEGLSPLEDS